MVNVHPRLLHQMSSYTDIEFFWVLLNLTLADATDGYLWHSRDVETTHELKNGEFQRCSELSKGILSSIIAIWLQTCCQRSLI